MYLYIVKGWEYFYRYREIRILIKRPREFYDTRPSRFILRFIVLIPGDGDFGGGGGYSTPPLKCDTKHVLSNFMTIVVKNRERFQPFFYIAEVSNRKS